MSRTIRLRKYSQKIELDNNEIVLVAGEKKKINCSATGGAGNYQYKVMYRKATTNKWTTKQDYSDNTTLSIKPSANVDYVIYIKAKDSLGKISSKTFDVRVSAGVTAAE